MGFDVGSLFLGTPRQMTPAELAKLDPTTNQVINGKLYTWRPDQIDDGTGNLIDDPNQTPGEGGHWVPADTHADPNLGRQLAQFGAVTTAAEMAANAFGGAGAGGAASGGGLPAYSAPAAVTGGTGAVIAGGSAASPFIAALKALAPVGAQYALEKLATKPLSNAVDVASGDQLAATNKAKAANDAAAKVAGNVYLTQRKDLQNNWSIPYQTLGAMLGLNIPQIGSGMDVVNSSIPGALPTGSGGVPTTTNPNIGGGLPYPTVTPANPMGLGSGLTVGTVRTPLTLKQLQALGRA